MSMMTSSQTILIYILHMKFVWKPKYWFPLYFFTSPYLNIYNLLFIHVIWIVDFYFVSYEKNCIHDPNPRKSNLQFSCEVLIYFLIQLIPQSHMQYTFWCIRMCPFVLLKMHIHANMCTGGGTTTHLALASIITLAI